jgi:glycosyltransferase involved in cell wall biosynthesis
MPGALLYTHTWLGADGFEGAVNLPHEVARHGIGHVVLPCDQERYRAGFPLAYMNAMYGAIDALLAVSLGEGFGVPTLEAQACGRPVIVGAWAAQEDLCFGGWALQRADALAFADGQGANVYIPQPAAISDALAHAYTALKEPGEAERVGQMAYEGAQALTLERVRDEHWAGVAAALEAQIAGETRRGVQRIVWPEEVLRAA